MPAKELSGIYLDNKRKPMIWRTYGTYPPVVSVPRKEARLCHFIDVVPRGNTQPYINDVQHILFVPGMSRDYTRRLAEAPRLEREFRSDNCKAVFVFSDDNLRQAARHIDVSGMEHKLHVVLPAYPDQPDNPYKHTGPFTILTISNKFWGRGVPLAIEVFRTLRKKYGKAVRMKLVCEDVPKGYPLVEDLELIRVRRLDGRLRAKLYQEANVFLLLSLHEFGVILETMARGIPTVSTPIGGGGWVLPGQTGLIVKPPFHLYGEGFGTKWKTWNQFCGIVKAHFERGDLSYMITEGVAYVEFLMNNPAQAKEMGRAAQRQQREKHSPKPRNRQVRRIYAEILKGIA